MKIKRGGRTSRCLELSRRTLLTRLISPPILSISEWTEVSSSADRWFRTLHNPTSTRQKEKKSRHMCTYQIIESHLFYFSTVQVQRQQDMSHDGEGFEYPDQETDNVQQQTTMSEHVSARHARAHTLARPFFTRPPCSLSPPRPSLNNPRP